MVIIIVTGIIALSFKDCYEMYLRYCKEIKQMQRDIEKERLKLQQNETPRTGPVSQQRY
jgi:hypothetical protein